MEKPKKKKVKKKLLPIKKLPGLNSLNFFFKD